MAYPGHKLRYRGDPRGGADLLSLLRIAAAALLILAAAAGCSASTPGGTVNDFISARIAGQEERAAELTVEEDLSGFIGGEVFLSGSGVSFDMSPAEVDGPRAVVTVHYHWDGEVVDIPYVCLRAGTKWKVALRETEDLWLGDSP